MEYITSRGDELPKSEKEMEERVSFNMWKKKLWPYKEVLPGDTLYWYESPSKSIVWMTRVEEIYRFQYENKEMAEQKLKEKFDDIDTNHHYFINASSEGFCFVYKVKPLKRLNLPIPKNMSFRREGWIRVDDNIAKNWLLQQNITDESILDDMVKGDSLIEQLQKLNKEMEEIVPERVDRIVSQTIRRDTKFINDLKKSFDFRCQFPGCDVRIPKHKGGFYIEVAHIKPVSQGGQSIIGNLLVLCPNHHKEFDYGDLEINKQTIEYLQGKLNGKKFEIKFFSN